MSKLKLTLSVGLAALLLIVTGACRAGAQGSVGTGTVVLSFDDVVVPALGFVGATDYLARFGITLSDVTPGGAVVVRNDTGSHVGLVSPPNTFSYVSFVGQRPNSFTLNLSTAVDSISFTRPPLLTGPSGVTHPQWSAHAFNVAGVEVATAGEGLISSFSNVPAQTFTLAAPGIVNVRFDSNNFEFASTVAVVLDHLVLRRSRATVAPSLEVPSAVPTRVAVGEPAALTITVPIADPALIPGSVNLQRLSEGDQVTAVLGTLHDDGLNGDEVAADGIFTLRVTLTEAAVGGVRLRVSAAFRGLLRRVASGVLIVPVSENEVTSTMIGPVGGRITLVDGATVVFEAGVLIVPTSVSARVSDNPRPPSNSQITVGSTAVVVEFPVDALNRQLDPETGIGILIPVPTTALAPPALPGIRVVMSCGGISVELYGELLKRGDAAAIKLDGDALLGGDLPAACRGLELVVEASMITVSSPPVGTLHHVIRGDDGSFAFTPADVDPRTTTPPDVPIVVLVHGWQPTGTTEKGNEHKTVWEEFLKRGHPAGSWVLSFQYDTTLSISENAAKLNRELGSLVENHKIAFLAHSQGGLVASVAYLTSTRQENIERIITLATPFGGAELATEEFTRAEISLAASLPPLLRILAARVRYPGPIPWLARELDQAGEVVATAGTRDMRPDSSILDLIRTNLDRTDTVGRTFASKLLLIAAERDIVAFQDSASMCSPQLCRPDIQRKLLPELPGFDHTSIHKFSLPELEEAYQAIIAALAAATPLSVTVKSGTCTVLRRDAEGKVLETRATITGTASGPVGSFLSQCCWIIPAFTGPGFQCPKWTLDPSSPSEGCQRQSGAQAASTDWVLDLQFSERLAITFPGGQFSFSVTDFNFDQANVVVDVACPR